MAKRWLPVLLATVWLTMSGRAWGQEEVPTEDPGLPRLQIGAEYLFLWMKPDSFPVLATHGSAADAVPGALGQPGTQSILSGNLGHDMSSAGRISGLYWLSDARVLGIEGNFFIVEQRSHLFSTSSSGATGSPVLARPFFNPVVNQEDSDPRALPNVLAGNVNVNYMTRLMGGEGNLRLNVNESPWLEGASIAFLGGVRYLRLDEKYLGYDTTTDLPVGSGNTTSINDNFTAYNQFVGGQVGAQVKYRWDCNLTCDVTGKVAVGPNFQTAEISGLTTITGLINGQGNQGLYAQRSNIGTHHDTTVAVLPEVAVNLGWEVTSYCRLKVGYTFFYVDHVLRPGQMIDRVVNIQPVGAPAQIGPARPAFTFQESSFWVQFLNLGVEFMF